MPVDSPPIRISRALGLGVRSIARAPKVWAFGMAVEAFDSLAQVAWLGVALAVLAQSMLSGTADGADAAPSGPSPRGVAMALGGSALAIALLGGVLRILYLSAAVPSLSASQRDPQSPRLPFLVTAAQALERTTVATLWMILLELGSRLLIWTALGCAWLSLGSTFARHRWVVPSLAEASFAVALAAAMGLAMAMFTRVFLVRAVRADQPVLVSAWEAGSQIFSASRGRFGSYLGILVVAAIVGLFAASMGQGPRFMASLMPPSHPLVQVALVWGGSVLSGLAAATVELGLLGAICAVDLDVHGELPLPPEPPKPVSPPPPEPVLTAEEILTARAMSGDGPSGTPEPTGG